MLACINGEFVPEENAVVSIFDRSFLYGDGLFEAVRVFNGRLFRWAAHFQRLAAGAKFLGIELPCGESRLGQLTDKLVRENRMTEALLRITVSRGCGPRGYSPKGATQPFFAIST